MNTSISRFLSSLVFVTWHCWYSGSSISWYRAILTAILLSACSLGIGQSLRFYHYSTEDGVAANSVFSVCQDSLGFMWFGTNNGLQRFDGHTFITYNSTEGDSTALPDNQIWAVRNGQHGDLWLGTQGGGLVRFDARTEMFEQYLFHDSLGLGRGPLWITQIVADEHGFLWVGTRRHGISRFNPEDGSFKVYMHVSDDPASLPDNAATTILRDGAGSFWVGTTKGLAHFDPLTETFSSHPIARADGAEPNVLSIHQHTDGTLWVGTMASGLYSYHPSTRHVRHFHPEGAVENALPARTVFKVLLDLSKIISCTIF